ncbi:MAG: SMI1/KNR4 family protein [Saprospiraceae bacterium]|jgi:hypothetical protein|nr:SMI1/KNR4 family protein [Saprospiraceae bacterium]
MRKFRVRPRFGLRNFDIIEKLVEGKFLEDFKDIMTNYSGLSVYENQFIDKFGRDWELSAFDDFTSIFKLTKEFKVNGCGLKVPFAFDPGGWHYCLSFDKDTYGKILVNRWTDHSPEEQFVVIADSFEEFINGLHEPSGL